MRLARLSAIGIAVSGLAASLWPRSGEEPVTVFVSGNLAGTLTPCGCTKPMAGGLLRRATAIRAYRTARTVVLDTGGFVVGHLRQDELKAETIAEGLAAMGINAIHLTSQEIALGEGNVLTLNRLAGDAFLGEAPSELSIPRHRVCGPFLVGGAHETDALPAAQALVDAAREQGLWPALLLHAPLGVAENLARELPALRLVVYRSSGEPPLRAHSVGRTWLTTPGDQGRSLVLLRYRGDAPPEYRVLPLGPEYAADPTLTAIYGVYQERVREERLLEAVPRTASEAFSGNERCGSCHQQAMDVWKKSPHARALATLEKDTHDWDPDCVGCHVVGLDKRGGFRSRAETPHLTDVGCESCHGAGERHSLRPYQVKMPKVGQTPCLTCHTTQTSPHFDFHKMWPTLEHK